LAYGSSWNFSSQAGPRLVQAATLVTVGATVHRLHAVPREVDVRELIDRARRHDPAAQRALFEMHKDRLAAQLQRMTGSPAAVDDLVQEVFIAAFRNLDGFRGESSLPTWLYRIALNQSRKWWDSDRRRRRRELRAGERSLGEAMSTPHDDLELREHHEQLYAALGSLPAKLREAFVARVIEGMSLQEASEALSLPISTVSYRTRRAEDLLCAALGVASR
jgi:RNA polymerase sigma-70 factor (ECF subfamily)